MLPAVFQTRSRAVGVGRITFANLPQNSIKIPLSIFPFPFSPEAPSSRASPHAPASASEFSAATPRPAPALPGVQGWTFSQQLGHHLCQEEEFIPLFCLFKFCQRRALAHSEALS